MRRWIAGTVATLAVLACAWWLWTASLEREIDRRILALRRAGLPTDRRFFVDPPIAPEDDAAPLYAEFAAWWDEHKSEDWNAPYWREPDEFEQEDWEAAPAWMDGVLPGVEQLRRAAGRHACSHDCDMSKPLHAWSVSHLITLFDAREIAGLEIEVAVHEGRYFARATAAVEYTWSLGRHVDDRTLWGALIRHSLEMEACRRLRRVAGIGGVDPARLRRIVAAWTARRPERTIEETLAWERAFTLEIVKLETPEELWSGAVPLRLCRSWIYRPLMDLFLLRQLARFEEGVKLARHLDRERLPALLVSTRKERTDRRWFEPWAPLGSWWAVVLAHARVRRDAGLRVTATGLDLLVHREAHGAWPENLDGFPDATDPFTGEPLVYERTDTGVRVAALDPEPDEDHPLEWRLSD